MSIDLTTQYLGLQLKNPLVASASPLCGQIETLRQLEDAGLAAAVLPSLFEEQIVHEERQINDLYQYQADSNAESLSYFPEMQEYRLGSNDYLQQIEKSKEAVSIPIIASLNGSSEGGWTRYAESMENAGADALELNIYFIPSDPSMTSLEVEQKYLDLVANVRAHIKIPLSVKMGPNFSSMASFALRLVEAGADGLVLFNRYLEPDIELSTLEVVPNLVLSTQSEMRVPLRWIAILRDSLPVSLAASSGIHDSDDVLKVILAGADVAMMTSTLLTRGIPHASQVLSGLQTWLAENEYASVQQMRGSVSRANCADPSAFERGNYMKALASHTADFAP